MTRQWTADEIQQMARGYQAACVLAAAADLDLFELLKGTPFSAADAAAKLHAGLRGVTILLDALCAMQLLEKQEAQYQIPPVVERLLTHGDAGSVLGITQHQANCLRRWAQLARTVKSGTLAPREPSLRGAAADYAAFIEAMDNVSGPVATLLVAELQPLRFRHLLDVGGASGTWTLALLRANADASATATIFDLPQVIPQAQARVAASGLAGRVKLVGGDFYVDDLPGGADLVWVSAIVHQNSRAQNRALFGRAFRALQPGGRILIRDIVMEASRTAPVAGALFAVNMLVSTAQGGTFTFGELREDLEAAGFAAATLLRRHEGMHSLVAATKPG